MNWNKVIALLDLTSLNEEDTEQDILALCSKALTPLGPVAAVCVYPRFVALAAKQLQQAPSLVKIATVVNFPHGTDTLATVLADIKKSLGCGANEMDMVFPKEKKKEKVVDFLAACKAACGKQALLKVILETGACSTDTIATNSHLALQAGADFLKTSTGKMPEGASPLAVKTLLTTIKTFSAQHHRRAGVKVSGGVRELAQVAEYLALADDIMGASWVSPATFRFGASQLLNKILQASLLC